MSSSGTRDRNGRAAARRRRRRRRRRRAGPRGAGGRQRPPAEAAAPRRVVEGGAGDQRHHGRRGSHAAPLPRHPGRRPGGRRRPGGSGPTSSADGTWSTFYGGPPDLSTTIEAYVALRLAGDAADSPPLLAAAAWVRSHGGIAGSRVFTRIWLALLGRWDWEDLPVVPPEIMFLPPWAPLNIYDFGCWARQTVVALTIVMAHRPARPLPFALDELRATEPAAVARSPRGPRSPRRQPESLRTTRGRLLALDRALHRYERLPAWFLPRRALRRSALRRAEQWIVRRQEADGLWGGIQPPVVYSIMALAPAGLSAGPPGDAGRPGRPGGLRHPRRPGPAPGGLPVAGVGHRPGDGGPVRCRRRPRRPGPGRRRPVARRRGDHHPGRLGGTPPAAGARRLGLRVRQRQLPRHRRHGRGRPGPAAHPTDHHRGWTGGLCW